ncbi:hypothetical protein C8J27_103196 [Rhodobacter aestuarii]|uniref:Uncharacterized protein n=1 Tax=Rhodobacter aestuarii TaxID=453582 RepID=A0A1N7K430_9RHOB|nr:hypothetical protein [Rhodobacter aestuarii]PTV95867.1 hypothetical protein C8J27_103196 [Rhodobacter aestuarii]SIS56308.1 hypothetical protein SAMN05421580_102238 [Rhodobacter aestuarii]
MTTPGEMVKCAATTLGVPEVTLTQIDRELVSHGMRTKGGRGKSAAKMGSNDVTNLLIAVLTGALIKDVAEMAREYSDLPVSSGDGKWSLADFPLPSVQSLPPDHTFGQALRAFIDAEVNREIDAALQGVQPSKVGDYVMPRHLHLEFRLLTPLPSAAITLIVGGEFREEHHYSLNVPNTTDEAILWAEGFIKQGRGGDMRRMQWFSWRTIKAMAKFLRGEE